MPFKISTILPSSSWIRCESPANICNGCADDFYFKICFTYCIDTIVVSIIHRIIKLQRQYHLLKVKYRGYSFDLIYATVSYSSAKGKSFTIFAVYKHFQLCVLKGKCLNMHKTYKLGFTVQHHYLFLYYTFECTCWENVILWVLFLY